MTQVMTNLEASVLETLRQLPVEKQKQVLDFALFMENQAASQGNDTRWETLLASEASQKFLSSMAEHVRADIRAGRMTEIDIVDGELKPK